MQKYSMSTKSHHTLSFSPFESYMVSYGIDRQISSKLPSLTTAANDADQVMEAFVTSGMIPRSNAHLYTASKDETYCKLAGMEESFLDCARRIGPEGVFVFFYSGHGIQIGNESALVPTDCDVTAAHPTYLSAERLGRWLTKVNCKAKHIFIFLDCCHAGGIGNGLKEFTNLSPEGTVYILSACKVDQKAISLTESLGQSIFTFFIVQAISNLRGSIAAMPTTAELPLQQMFATCQTCSKAVSNLLIEKNDAGGIDFGNMEPVVKVIKGKRRIQSDAGDADSFHYVYDVCDEYHLTSLQLTELTMEYIRGSIRPALHKLNEHKLLKDPLLGAALCMIMRSIANIELCCNQSEVTRVALAVKAFLKVAYALKEVAVDVNIPRELFIKSLLYYQAALVSHSVDVSDFNILQK